MLVKQTLSPHKSVVPEKHGFASTGIASSPTTPGTFQKAMAVANLRNNSSRIEPPSIFEKASTSPKTVVEEQQQQSLWNKPPPTKKESQASEGTMRKQNKDVRSSPAILTPDLFMKNMARNRTRNTITSSPPLNTKREHESKEEIGDGSCSEFHAMTPDLFLKHMSRQPRHRVSQFNSHHAGIQQTTQPRYSTSSSACTPWIIDGHFAKSKICKARMEKAAVVLQKHARRFLLRDRIQIEKAAKGEADRQAIYLDASTKIQAIARGMLGRTALKKHIAVRCIQAGFRGWKTRKMDQVFVLEKKLADIEVQRQRELKEIEHWKMTQLDRFARRQDREASKEACKKKKVGEELDKIEKQFIVLRKENKQLRAQNDYLEKRCDELLQENEQLEKNLRSINQGIARLTKFVESMEKQIPRSEKVCGLFEDRTKKAEGRLSALNERIEYEGKVSHLRLEAIARIVSQVQSNEYEKELGEHVMNLAMLEA